MIAQIERCLLRATLSEIAKYSPEGGFRVDFLNPIKEVIKGQRGLMKRRVVGLVAPTGTGKTSFITALTLWAVARCGVKSTVLVGGKANRATILLRFLEAVARMREAGLRAPRVLVFASKIDTCIHNELEKIIAEYRVADNDTARKLMALFYTKERRIKDRCPHLLNLDNKYSTIRQEILNYNVLVVGPVPKEVIERMKNEAPTAYKLYSSGKKLFADVTELGRRHGICPYELGKRLMMDTDLIDVVVLDSVYLAYRTNPGFAEVFTRARLLVIDEVHETLFTSRVKVTIDYTGDKRNVLDDVSPKAVDYIEKAIDEIFRMDKDNISEQVIELEDRRYEYAVPDRSLTTKDMAYVLLKRAVQAARSAMKKGRYSLMAEAEVSTLETLLDFERLSYRVSLADPEIRSGTVVAIKEFENGKLVRAYLVPTLLSPRLKQGEDFGFAVVSSGTLLPLHLTLVFKMTRREAENLMAVVRWPVIANNRVNYVVDYPAYYRNREEVAKAILSIKECVPLIVVASTSWEKHLPGFTILRPPTQYHKVAAHVSDVRRRLTEERCPRLLVSPHLGISKGEDLVDPGREFKAVVIAASESVLPPDPDVITDMAVVARKYPLPEATRYHIGWVSTFVVRSLLRVVQTVGRFQRSEKHRLKVVYIGRFYHQRLPHYYEDLYGPILDYVEPADQAGLTAFLSSVAGGWRQ